MKSLQPRASLYLILGFNLYLIWYYHQHPEGFKTLLLIYWLQSALLGFFTFLLLMRVSYFPRPRPAGEVTTRDGCLPWFFAVHYGMFHMVYFVFLVVADVGTIDWSLVRITAAILLLSELMDFIRKWQPVARSSAGGVSLMFLPYLRVVPMHLAILGASFWAMSNITVFLVLKTLADAGMYLLTDRLYFRPAKN